MGIIFAKSEKQSVNRAGRIFIKSDSSTLRSEYSESETDIGVFALSASNFLTFCYTSLLRKLKIILHAINEGKSMFRDGK